jgi:hypothetical protein
LANTMPTSCPVSFALLSLVSAMQLTNEVGRG